MQNPFATFMHANYDNVSDNINLIAEEHKLNVNVIPDGIDNIDIDDDRVNIWVNQHNGEIYKITFG